VTEIPASLDQALVRLHAGALQEDREERRADILADQIDQYLSGEARFDELMAKPARHTRKKLFSGT